MQRKKKMSADLMHYCVDYTSPIKMSDWIAITLEN